MGRPGQRGDGPKRVAASLPEAARRMGADGAVELAALGREWAGIVGEQVAAHARPVSLTGGVLTVAADHHAWAAELRLFAAELRKRVNRHCPSVSSIVVVVSPSGGSTW